MVRNANSSPDRGDVVSARGLLFAATRPCAGLPLAVGLALLLGGLTLAGWIVLSVGMFRTLATLSNHPDIEHRLRLRDLKWSHGIRRPLTPEERCEVLALSDYSTHLKSAGLDSSLAGEVMEEGFAILAREERGRAVVALRRFRQSLPTLPATSSRVEGVAARIHEEWTLVEASRREVETVA